MFSKCPACSETAEKNVFFEASQFSTSGILVEKKVAQEAKFVISMEACSNCFFMQLSKNKSPVKNYTLVDRDTNSQLPHYKNKILSIIESNLPHKSAHILEVGANDGTFMNELLINNFNVVSGVEPSEKLAARCIKDGLDVSLAYFNRDFAKNFLLERGSVDAVICRHTLEHVPNPKELADAIFDILSETGFAYIEVPDALFMLQHGLAHEVWDEHISYFTKVSLKNLFMSSGFEITYLESWEFRGTRNLVMTIRKKKENSDQSKIDPDLGALSLQKDFQENWDLSSYNWNKSIDVTDGPIFGIGASHVQINYFNYSELGEKLDFLIDDDLLKVKKFAQFATGIPIISTKQFLNDHSCGSIIFSAFNQPGWQTKIENLIATKSFKKFHPYT